MPWVTAAGGAGGAAGAAAGAAASPYRFHETYLIRIKGFPGDYPANKGVLHEVYPHSSNSCFFDNIFDFILL